MVESSEPELPFETVIILENEKSQRKYLLPAYKFKSDQDGNSVFSSESCIDKSSVLEKSAKYFEFKKNKFKQFVGQDADANLYLALLYRNLGEHEEQAVQSLRLSDDLQANTESQVEIANMIMDWHDLSPVGAAFDCKLLVRLAQHQRKWTKGVNAWVDGQESQKLKKFGTEQFRYYRKCLSLRKDGVNIVPLSCRLRPDEYDILAQLFPRGEQSTFISVYPASTNEVVFLQNRFLEFYDQAFSKAQGISKNNQSLKIRYGLNDTDKHYFFANYHLICLDLQSKDTDKIRTLKAMLFFLLRSYPANEKEMLQYLVKLLLLAEKEAGLPVFSSPSDCFSFLHQKFSGKIFHAGLGENVTVGHKYIRVVSLPMPNHVMANVPLSFEFYKDPLSNRVLHPLMTIVKQFYDVGSSPIAKSEHLFTEKPLIPVDPIFEDIVRNLNDGHKRNAGKMSPDYSYKKNLPFDQLRKCLKSCLSDSQKEADSLLQRLLEKASLPSSNPSAWLEYQTILVESGQRPKMTLALIVQAILTRNVAQLQWGNPFITQQDFTEILELFCEHALASSRVHQFTEAINMISGVKSIDQLSLFHQYQLGLVLDKRRYYNYRQYPEFLIYEYISSKMIREEQCEAIVKLIKLIEAGIKDPEQYRHALLQFVAGGGKTSLMIPILCFIFARMGFLPIIFTTLELFKIALNEIPPPLRDIFQQLVEGIDIGLDHVWTSEELKLLLEDLKEWCGQKCVLMRPEGWHSIHITSRIARMDSRPNRKH